MDAPIWLQILAGMGLTLIITRSWITKGWRDGLKEGRFKHLVNCSQCTGVWVGKAGYILVNLDQKVTVFGNPWQTWDFVMMVMMVGFSVSLGSLMADAAYRALSGSGRPAETPKAEQGKSG